MVQLPVRSALVRERQQMVLYGLFGNSGRNDGTNRYLRSNLLEFWRFADRRQYDQPWIGIGIFHVLHRYHSIAYTNSVFDKISGIAKLDSVGDWFYLYL